MVKGGRDGHLSLYVLTNKPLKMLLLTEKIIYFAG
ncbi:hypothetical protein GGQ57_001940 [Parabacteroides faecis]|uniref:Transcriptional regulator n=1 Tax=Parabacteroides faecis TaxID=1217282 RepID=A0ABR6KL10_9BACT|nr:hypothetical protein [Parabacteroides faecis]